LIIVCTTPPPSPPTPPVVVEMTSTHSIRGIAFGYLVHHALLVEYGIKYILPPLLFSPPPVVGVECTNPYLAKVFNTNFSEVAL
jgi:hypothetical protein